MLLFQTTVWQDRETIHFKQLAILYTLALGLGWLAGTIDLLGVFLSYLFQAGNLR
jgi:hypothetical protein